MKKLFTLLLGIAILFSISVCAHGEGEPIEVSMLVCQIGNIKLDDPNLKAYQKMNEVGNIQISPIMVTEESYPEKFAALLASGELPDIIYTSPVWKTVQDIGPKGVFVPVSDYYDQLPKLKELLDKHPLETSALLSSDGKLYQFPTIFENVVYASTGLVMREDLLEAAGIDAESIQTMDDLYNALAGIKEQNGGKPVLSARFGISNMSVIANMFGSSFAVRYDPKEMKFAYPVYDDGSKAAIQFLNRLYSDGILHPEWASMSDAIWEEAVSAGELAAYADNMQMLAARNSDLSSSVGPEARLIPVLPPEVNGEIQPWGSNAAVMLGGWTSYAINASVSGDKLERILKVMNWIYDYENSNEALVYGEEGVTFVYGDDGMPTYIVDTDWENGNGPLPLEYGVNVLSLVVTPEKFYEVTVTPVAENPFIAAMDLYEEVYRYAVPPVSFTKEESERLKVIKTPLDTYVAENVIKFIHGVRPMDEWDGFVDELNAMHISEVEDIYNQALSRLQ